MPFRRFRAVEPTELPAQRVILLDKDLAAEVADHCRVIGDNIKDFIHDALVLALDQSRPMREAADADG